MDAAFSVTPGVVLGALTPGTPGWDVATVEALAAAARIDAREPRIDRMPSLPVPVIELDGARWVAGPVDVPGYRLTPPIGLCWQQGWGELWLTVEAFWSPWWTTTSAEYAALRTAERALDAAGLAGRP